MAEPWKLDLGLCLLNFWLPFHHVPFCETRASILLLEMQQHLALPKLLAARGLGKQSSLYFFMKALIQW